MAERQPKMCVLTGAGASKPLDLPTMDTLLPLEFESALGGHERDVFDIASNWAVANSREGALDFELLFTALDLIARLQVSDPLAMAFVPPRNGAGGFQFKQGPQGGAMIAGGNLEGFQKAAKALAEKLKIVVHDRLSTVDPAKAAKLYHPFLALLSEIVGSDGEIDFFTTNYDRAVELSYEDDSSALRLVFEVIGGFPPGQRASRPRWDAADYQRKATKGLTVRLYKLHGSLDWRQEGGSVRFVGAEEYVTRSVVIYPVRKPSVVDEPFKTLLGLFQQRVADAKVCLVIGSSLRDDHIRHVIIEGVRAEALHVVVVDPNAATIKAALESEAGKGSARFLHTVDGGFGEPKTLQQIKTKVRDAMSRGQRTPHS